MDNQEIRIDIEKKITATHAPSGISLSATVDQNYIQFESNHGNDFVFRSKNNINTIERWKIIVKLIEHILTIIKSQQSQPTQINKVYFGL